MTQTVTILAMHPGMHGLFPDKPDHWEFITHGESAEATIAELGGEVEVLLSASIEKLDKSVLEQLPNLKWWHRSPPASAISIWMPVQRAASLWPTHRALIRAMWQTWQWR